MGEDWHDVIRYLVIVTNNYKWLKLYKQHYTAHLGRFFMSNKLKAFFLDSCCTFNHKKYNIVWVEVWLMPQLPDDHW